MRPSCLPAVLFAITFPCAARICDADSKTAVPRHAFELFGGYSPDSATVIGTAADRQFAVVGLSYSYRCRMWEFGSLSYTVAAMPAAIVIQPAEAAGGRHGVWGFGVAPVGGTLEFLPASRVRPFAESLLGVIASDEPVPVRRTDATGLNFLFTLGGGIRWYTSPGRAISAGYRFLHISNAGTTTTNPGLDNNVIYGGYAFLF